MNWYDTIKSDMIEAYKNGYRHTASTLKVLLGDIQRDPNKDFSDEKVMSVIKRNIKLAKESLRFGNEDARREIELLEKYLPQPVSRDELKEFLDTVDFSKLKSKMQAIGLAVKYFAPKPVDADDVKELLDD